MGFASLNPPYKRLYHNTLQQGSAGFSRRRLGAGSFMILLQNIFDPCPPEAKASGSADQARHAGLPAPPLQGLEAPLFAEPGASAPGGGGFQ